MHHRYPALIDELEERSYGTSVRFLQNDETEPFGTRFLGGCMWTDYSLFPLRFNDSLEQARRAVSDYRLIRKADDGPFRPEHAIEHQRETLLWLREQLDAPFAGKTAVVTHHLPSARSIEPKHREHSLAPAYVSNIELLVQKADLWVHALLASAKVNADTRKPHLKWTLDFCCASPEPIRRRRLPRLGGGYICYNEAQRC
jgi:hypothetical protein